MTSDRPSHRPAATALAALLGAAGLGLVACVRGEASDLATSEAVGQGTRIDGGDMAPGAALSITAESEAASEPRGPAAEPEAHVPAPAPTTPTPSPGTSRPTGEPRLITFADLSLIGLDVDAIFDPSEDEVGLSALPETIRALDRTLVAIEGYMIPMEWEGTRVRAFMLVRDMAGCCFGQMPQPDEWVEVVMRDDEVADYYPYVPVLATGLFELAGETDDLGYVTGAYRLRGDGVTDEW